MKCDFDNDYFLDPSSDASEVNCILNTVYESFYTIEQNLDFRSDSELKFNLEFYTVSGTDLILLAQDTSIDLFTCFVKISESRKVEAKSCKFTVED